MFSYLILPYSVTFLQQMKDYQVSIVMINSNFCGATEGSWFLCLLGLTWQEPTLPHELSVCLLDSLHYCRNHNMLLPHRILAISNLSRHTKSLVWNQLKHFLVCCRLITAVDGLWNSSVFKCCHRNVKLLPWNRMKAARYWEKIINIFPVIS